MFVRIAISRRDGEHPNMHQCTSIAGDTSWEFVVAAITALTKDDRIDEIRCDACDTSTRKSEACIYLAARIDGAPTLTVKINYLQSST